MENKKDQENKLIESAAHEFEKVNKDKYISEEQLKEKAFELALLSII